MDRKVLFLILGVASLAIVSFQTGAYLIQFSGNNPGSQIRCDQSTNSIGAGRISSSLLINYGNGTLHWYNQTIVPVTWNAYTLTTCVANGNVQAEFYGPPLNEHFVQGINGLVEHGSFSWVLWRLCTNENAWSESKVGADLIQLSNGQVLAWMFEIPSNGNLPPPPVPGSKAIGYCS